MTKVIIAGASGRMGQRIGAMVHQNPNLTLAGGFEQPDSPAVGRDMGEIGGYGTVGVPIAAGLEEIIDQGDVVIDFTFHAATMAFAAICASHQKGMVIGTTGLSQKNLAELRIFSAQIPIVQSANMAVGVNVMFKIAKKIASILGDDYDMEIVEAHHNLKKDAPSGTALRLGEMLAEGVGRDLGKVGVYERNGIIGERSKSEIGIQTVRGGDIVGEHTIYYCGPGERIELTHRAHNRDNFARGAVQAAAWLADKKKGMFTMFDVLDLTDL
ncbi:MAG: 4-hydroxy-tetrahydrodipicolinate reductase [Desulfurivibrionaceae bacterium]|nr:4-hydroxy-tetrahydrodipicolinate reductase [Desulfurivibrionaceae bacterium]